MLDIRLIIRHIDYEKSAAALYPMLKGKIAGKEKLRELEKLLDKLGDDALPVIQKLLGYLREDVKNEIAVWILSSRGDRLRGTVDRALERLFSGMVVTVGALSAELEAGGQLMLLARQVEVDYPALLASPLVGEKLDALSGENALLKSAARFAVSMGARMSPEAMEKQGLALLGNEKVQARLLRALREALEQMGLYMEFQGMALDHGEVICLPAELESAKDEGLIPDAFEDALLDALAAWLRESIHGAEYL